MSKKNKKKENGEQRRGRRNEWIGASATNPATDSFIDQNRRKREEKLTLFSLAEGEPPTTDWRNPPYESRIPPQTAYNRHHAVSSAIGVGIGCRRASESPKEKCDEQPDVYVSTTDNQTTPIFFLGQNKPPNPPENNRKNKRTRTDLEEQDVYPLMMPRHG